LSAGFKGRVFLPAERRFLIIPYGAMARCVTERNPVSGEEPLTAAEYTKASAAVERAVEKAAWLAQLLSLAQPVAIPAPGETSTISEEDVLRHFGFSPLEDVADVVRRPLETIFGIRLDSGNAAEQIETVKETYRSASGILSCDRLL
jgi:hypothetical protein